MREMAESSQSGGESVEQVGMARQVTEATLADVATPSGWADRLAAWAARHPRAPLALAIALTLLVRVALVIRTHAMIDGDEALLGIQAERILHGQYPTYFYLQPYMGSLEAYLAAALFAVFGPSSWALRAVPILLSPLLVYLTWRLAYALLPRDARTTPLLAGLAALLAAVPPLYDTVAELRSWGGQIEVYIITLALLLVTVMLRDAIHARARSAPLAWRWLLWGFLAGLGIWINPLITYALLACGLWLLAALVERAYPTLWARLLRRPAPSDTRPNEPLRAFAPLLAALPGLAIGGLPAWIYAAQHHAENLLVYVTQTDVSPAVSGAARHGRLFLNAAITARYATCVAPRVLDGALPAEPLATLPLRLLLLLPPVIGIAGAFVLARRSDATAKALRVGLPLLYAGVITAIFCLGTSAWASTKPCERDWAGRYAVPLALIEPFLLLALIVAAPRLWQLLRRRPLTPQQMRRGWSLALAVVLLTGAVQLASYTLADPAATFQSPYYRRVPLDQSELLDYLKAHDIHAAWANHWLGNIVTFETNGQITTADYYDQVALGGLRRPPGALETVSAADRPSFIIITHDPHPLLAQLLDQQGITYTLAVLPRSGLVVITPNRTVPPGTVVPGLAEDYPY
ncbi:MAG: hypothetical protein ACXWQZ_06230 [Ktedonobacterales bacterium]